MSFIVQNGLINSHDGSWPVHTDIHCFYCVHPFTSMPLTAPKSRTSIGSKYITHGVFCSLPCALKYTDIHAGFNSEEEKMMLRVMARDVFQVPNAFTAKSAIDARNLKIFGGTMTIDDYRAASAGSVLIKTLTAPFIQAHMVTVLPGGAASATVPTIQEEGGGGGAAAIKGLRRPSQLAAPPPPDIAAPALFTPLPSAAAAQEVQSTFGGAAAAAMPKRAASKAAGKKAAPALPAHASLLQFISKADK